MLAQRVASAAILVPLLVVVLLAGPAAIGLAVAAIAFLAGVETFRLLRQAGHLALGWLGTAIGVILVVEAALLPGGGAESLVVIAAGVILAAVGALVRPDPRDGLATWQWTVFGGLYVGLLSYLPRIVGTAPPLPGTAPLAGALDAGRWWLLVCVLGVWAYDTAAYFAGRRIGGPRFLVHVSPSKTWAGAIGGLLAATAVAAALLAGLGQPPAMALLLGPLLAASAQAGDLAESLLKRAAGAKESGDLIPGHGGILDRVDSFLFAAPAVYFYVLVAVR